ncbi:MAG: hypothetical protein JWO30_281 [Fibrobacteres bacterium]|nr:hypothetical protein [Fibrobacterota bacterium]
MKPLYFFLATLWIPIATQAAFSWGDLLTIKSVSWEADQANSKVTFLTNEVAKPFYFLQGDSYVDIDDLKSVMATLLAAQAQGKKIQVFYEYQSGTDANLSRKLQVFSE